jgi:hypothetical protein
MSSKQQSFSQSHLKRPGTFIKYFLMIMHGKFCIKESTQNNQNEQMPVLFNFFLEHHFQEIKYLQIQIIFSLIKETGIVKTYLLAVKDNFIPNVTKILSVR